MLGDRKKLLRMLQEKALRFGQVELTSGKLSSYYCDGKMVSLDPEGIPLIGKLFFSKVQKFHEVEAVGGMEIGAIPIAVAVSYYAREQGRLLRTFVVRKEEKHHGTRKKIEGPLHSGDRVVIVDDVVTTGTSVIKAIRAVEKYGAEVKGVVVLVDRLEGAREAIEEAGYQFEALFTRQDLGVNDDLATTPTEVEGRASGR